MLENELVQVIGKLAHVFRKRKIQHAMIGGVAVGVRGRPRATKDVDFIVYVPALAFPGLLEELVEQGFDMDVIETTRRWTADRMVVLRSGRVRVDWLQPVLPIYASVLEKAEPMQWADSEIRVAAPEGIILTKMLAFRPQDQVDIESLLTANRDAIDVDYIRREWSAVSEGEHERTAWLEAAIARNLPAKP
jgi:hypothetical protein